MSPNTSNVTLSDNLSLATNSQVSWPTILWALLPIVFNSMTQPAGRLASSITAEQSFYLRASPVLCAVDALNVLSQTTYLAVKHRSPRHAIRHVSMARYQDFNDASSTRTQLQSLQENDIFRAILFVFGVLPQTLKVYACTGIPGTQALASLYLIPWIILELLVIIPARYGEHSYTQIRWSEQKFLDTMNAIAALVCYLAIHLSDSIAIYLLFANLYQTMHLREPPPTWSDTFAVTMILGFYTLFYLSHLSPGIDGKWGMYAFELFLYVYWLLLDVRIQPSVVGKIDALWMIALRLGQLASSIGLADEANYDDDHEISFKKFTQVWRVVFFFMQVVTAVGYYCIKYDSRGTEKPGWAGYLG